MDLELAIFKESLCRQEFLNQDALEINRLEDNSISFNDLEIEDKLIEFKKYSSEDYIIKISEVDTNCKKCIIEYDSTFDVFEYIGREGSKIQFKTVKKKENRNITLYCTENGVYHKEVIK